MIPEVITDIQSVAFKTEPSLNYKMILDGDRIINKCDKLEAMKQIIYKILMTERYKYFIYSWNFGIELADLFGMPVYYVVPEIERRVTEALMQDDRIENVRDFDFDLSKRNVVAVTFVVDTIFGSVNAGREVNY